MKLGIFGGSFNPVHIGHLLVAEDIIEKLKLDKIIFIPAFRPPHKAQLLSFEQRWKMLKLAIEKNPVFERSSLEKKRGGKSFTIDTLRELKMKYPKDQLYFVMGTDQYAELSSWKEPNRLFGIAKIAVIQRPGFPKEKFGTQKPAFIEVIQIDIASAEIRNRIRQNRSVRYMLPEKVRQYIIKNRLYLNA
jgi:nicotinate-nucleotide adenylyltransferase